MPAVATFDSTPSEETRVAISAQRVDPRNLCLSIVEVIGTQLREYSLQLVPLTRGVPAFFQGQSEITFPALLNPAVADGDNCALAMSIISIVAESVHTAPQLPNLFCCFAGTKFMRCLLTWQANFLMSLIERP
jgi:hypothetical protein